MTTSTVTAPTASDLIGLLDSIKLLLECNLLGIMNANPISAGEDEITVDATCPFKDGDSILIYNSSATTTTTAYQRQVMVKPNNVLWLDSPIPNDIQTPQIQRMISDSFLRAIYVDDPPTKLDFPCLTIDGEVALIEPFALGGTSNVIYLVDISVYADGQNYDEANRRAWSYAREIEHSLFHRISPARDRDRPQIWKSSILSIRQNHQTNQQSTLKVVTISYQVEEIIMRFAAEMNAYDYVNPVS